MSGFALDPSLMDLTAYCWRLTPAGQFRVRATFFVAPGLADTLRRRLTDRGIRAWVPARSSSTVVVDAVADVVRLVMYLSTDKDVRAAAVAYEAAFVPVPDAPRHVAQERKLMARTELVRLAAEKAEV